MRGILWLGILVICLVWLKFEAYPPPVSAADRSSTGASTAPAHGHWRRTETGWEDRRAWRPARPPYQPRLHPGVVVAFEVLACALALLAWDGRRVERNSFRS